MQSVDDFYSVLRVSPKATQEEIKEAYKRIAFECHPDKCQLEEGAHLFAKAARAYSVLSDTVARALYDVDMRYRPDSMQERRRINRLKRNEAESSVMIMEDMYNSRLEYERSRNGLIIVEARYGDLMSWARYRTYGSVIDVTVPLQCSVDESALLLQGGCSKSLLPGFYDPTSTIKRKSQLILVDDETVSNIPFSTHTNQLFVRYKFLGRMHECVVADTEEVCIPVQSHLVDRPHGECVSETLATKPADRRRLQQQKLRRRAVLLSSLAVAIGMLLIRRNKMKTTA